MRNLPMAIFAAVFIFGCDDGRDPTDGGITLPDAGGGGTEDAGGTGDPDGGAVDECPPVSAMMPTESAVCVASTLTCLMGATTAEAQNACIMADPNPTECNGCIVGDFIFTCSNTPASCDGQWGDVVCCVDDECAGQPASCADTAISQGGACEADMNNFFTCGNSESMAGRCGITGRCFMGDGGGGAAIADDEPLLVPFTR